MAVRSNTPPLTLAAPPAPDPAWVNPLHLPALHHVAADLDAPGAPVRIVAPAELGACEFCPDGALPTTDAFATVVALDPDGFHYRLATCPLHLHGEVVHHARHDRPTVIEVPARSRQWFERSDRETYYALDEVRGIVVGRTRDGGWAAWDVIADNVTQPRLLATFPADHGDHTSRLTAECWAQAHAAAIAAAAFEAGHVVAELRPATVLDGAA